MAMMSPANASSIGRRSRPRKAEQLGQPRLLDDLAVAGHRLDRHVHPRDSGVDAPGQHPAEIGIVLERRAEHRERLVEIGSRPARRAHS